MMGSGCGSPVPYTFARGHTYKTLPYKCGNTGVDGFPVLCDKCAEDFDSHQYRQERAEDGENIDDEY